ncbi:ALF repeat-containing protein, partial [Streptomyces sp. NPDC057557]|uniref:ALF repeat-containing protein n=1 Tax=Streptomyces sp. NPDC057557 TaxID=3346167 RepID=UPI003684D074
ATKSTTHANAATEAANAASSAVLKAQEIYALAREVETEELLGRTNEGIELARDHKAADDARIAKLAEFQQAVKDRDTERDRLVAVAAEPGADLKAVAGQGRKLAVLVMKNGTAWGRAAAEAALAGPDDVVIDYLRNGWTTAKEQDDRSYVERLAEESSAREVREAAETALDGDAAAITAFINNGQYQAAAQGMRVAIAQTVDGAGPILTEAGQKALATGDPKKYSAFLTDTQHTARTQDERVRAAQLVSSGGPEVKSAARIALEGSPQTLHAFIATGQYKAQRQDLLNATHVAQVQKLIADAAKIAATAQQNAATAQKVAALARKAAAEANEWAAKANASATQAQRYADEAAQHAKDAEASAASAASSAKTARNAANSANIAASDAANSAADATLSSEMAQVHASTAWYSADQARNSAIAAGKDAAAALTASTEAFTIAVTKKREEEEARRKAAVEDKEKNEAGQRAAELYRCGQAIVPCDPQDYIRWCTQSPIDCQILEHGKEIGDALEHSLEVAKELAGLGELEACLQNKDFEHCWSLAADVLVGAKLRALEKAFDSLKLLKRGCKIASRAAGVTRVALASSGDIPCFEHDVRGLPQDVEDIPDSFGCEACARRIRDSLGDGELRTIKPRPNTQLLLPNYRGKDSGWYNHVVLVLNGRVYDAWTARGGETVAEYKARWTRANEIDFGF